MQRVGRPAANRQGAGQQAEEQAGHNRQPERPGKHRRVDRDVPDGELRLQRDERPHPPDRGQGADRTTGRRQQHALRQELAQEPATTATERCPYRQLPAAG